MIEQYQILGGELVKIRISENKKGTFKKNGRRNRLNDSEIQEIIRLYPDVFNWQLERKFDASQSTILNIRRKHNLKKSDEIMNKMRFKKGHEPFNKNKSHPVKNSGQFNSGHMPKNHRQVGETRLQRDKSGNQYYYIKISEPNKWQLLHRYKWEQEYGKIPEGLLLVFKDRNSLNTEPENLELITRKENMDRNRNYKKFSETMKALWRKERMRAIYGLKRETRLRINI